MQPSVVASISRQQTIKPTVPDIKVISVATQKIADAPKPVQTNVHITTHEHVHDKSKITSDIVAGVKLDSLLKKIREDILMEKLDRAKESYKDALMLYKAMNVHDKTHYYDAFYLSFKKLDGVLHQKSLQDLLDRHLSSAKDSQRPFNVSKEHKETHAMEKHVVPDIKQSQVHASINIKPTLSSAVKNAVKDKHVESSQNNSVESLPYTHVESLTFSPINELPVVVNHDSDTTRVYELIEEAYFNIDNDNPDLAMLKYFKALETYRKLSLQDKRKSYSDIYALFKKLSHTKRSVIVSEF